MNLRNLFDYQKIADNKQLSDIISDVESRYGEELSDDDLEFAVAGTGQGQPTAERFCDKCKCNRMFRLLSGGRAICTECNSQILL